MASRARWYRQVVIAYDWGYRLLHGLDRPAACIGPVLRVERRRLRRTLRLADGTRLRRTLRLADGTRLRPRTPIGVLHLDNRRAPALHGDGLRPAAIGFEFRCLFPTSLQALATLAADGGPLASLQAHSVTTLFHDRLPMLGFAPAAGDRSLWRPLVTRYERALLSSLHPTGAARLRRGARRKASRLWISREAVRCWPDSGRLLRGQACHLEKRSVGAEPSGKE